MLNLRSISSDLTGRSITCLVYPTNQLLLTLVQVNKLPLGVWLHGCYSKRICNRGTKTCYIFKAGLPLGKTHCGHIIKQIRRDAMLLPQSNNNKSFYPRSDRSFLLVAGHQAAVKYSLIGLYHSGRFLPSSSFTFIREMQPNVVFTVTYW